MTPQTETELVALIRELDKKIDVGFADVRADLKVLDNRLTEVENKVDKLDGKVEKINSDLNGKLDRQDNRLWAFVALVLSAALGTIWKILN
jgi:hypothetical protein